MKTRLLYFTLFSILAISPSTKATSIDDFLESHSDFQKSDLEDLNIPSDAVYAKTSESTDVVVYGNSGQIIAYEFRLKFPKEDSYNLMDGARSALVQAFPEERYSINRMNGQFNPEGTTFELIFQIFDNQLFPKAKEAQAAKAQSRISEYISEYAPAIQP